MDAPVACVCEMKQHLSIEEMEKVHGQPAKPVTSVRLATCSYGEYRQGMGLGVRSSLGEPKWMPGLPWFEEITPQRWYLRKEWDEYVGHYRRQLDRHGPGKLAKKIEFLARQTGADTLVFLCYEKVSKPGNWCHRSMFADWWEERTGQKVYELGESPAAEMTDQDHLF